MFFLFVSVSIVAGGVAHYCDLRAQAFRLPEVPIERYRLVPLRLLGEGLYSEPGEVWRKRAVAAIGWMIGAFLAAFLVAMVGQTLSFP